jgi:hypothetical protein
MKSIYKKSFFCCSLLFGFCASKQDFQETMPQEIASIYYQKWTSGDAQIDGGFNFFVTFKKALPIDVVLKKVHFHNQQALFLKTSDTVFVASFKKQSKPDYNLSGDSKQEYGNKPPQILASSFKLKGNQAVLEYEKEGKIYFYNCKKVAKKTPINYPIIQKNLN